MMRLAFATGRMRSKRCAGAGASQSQIDSTSRHNGSGGVSFVKGIESSAEGDASARIELALQFAELEPRRRGLDEAHLEQRADVRHQRLRFSVPTARCEQLRELELHLERRVRILADAAREDLHGAPQFILRILDMALV